MPPLGRELHDELLKDYQKFNPRWSFCVHPPQMA